MANPTHTLIASTTLSANTTNVVFGAGETLPQTYKHLVVYMSVRNSGAGTGVNNFAITVNNNTTNNYLDQLLYQSGSSFAGTTNGSTNLYYQYAAGGGNDANTFAHVEFWLPNYANTSLVKSFRSTGGITDSGTTTYFQWQTAQYFASTNAITSIQINGAWATGSSFFLYGLNDS
jgi:hypothetical protein